ncbi:unnamed protein product, partial [Pleuronectes platessa]
SLEPPVNLSCMFLDCGRKPVQTRAQPRLVETLGAVTHFPLKQLLCSLRVSSHRFSPSPPCFFLSLFVDPPAVDPDEQGPTSEHRLTLAEVAGGDLWAKSGFNVSIHAAIRSSGWKLLTGYPGCSVWFPRPGHNSSEASPSSRDPLKPVMLFNIDKDPEERAEVSADFPAVVDYLLSRLHQHQKSALPINFPDDDPKCDPGPDRAWGPWV